MNRSQAIAAGAAAALLPRAAWAQDVQKLRVGFSPAGESLAHGAFAQEGGFFAKAGIAAEMIAVPNGGAMTAGIVSGAIDVGPSNVASMAAAYAHGLRLNLFAPSVIISSSAPPTTILAVRSDSPIHSAKDFAGKTIACNTLRDLQQAAVMTWLDKNGGDLKVGLVSGVTEPRSARRAGGQTHRCGVSGRTVHLVGQARRHAVRRSARTTAWANRS